VIDLFFSFPSLSLVFYSQNNIIMPHFVETREEFEKIITSNKAVIVDFTASWCGPCKRIGPVFEELSKTHTNIVFIKVDVDVNDEVTSKYQIEAMPTFVLFLNGQKADSFSGADTTKLNELVAKAK